MIWLITGTAFVAALVGSVLYNNYRMTRQTDTLFQDWHSETRQAYLRSLQPNPLDRRTAQVRDHAVPSMRRVK